MKHWKKSDIGSVILYRKVGGLKENDKIVIYNVNLETPNTVGFVEYPIALNSKIYSPLLNSKIGLVGIVKNQKKYDEKYLEKAGDWCFIDKVSKDERGVLEIIAKTPKRPSDII